MDHIISCGLKEKKMFYVTKTKECRGKEKKKKKHLSIPPPREPQTPFSSSGTLDFLSICLGIDTLKATHCPYVSQFSQFSRSVVSNSLRPHGLQHDKPSCPLPTPRVYSNSCPLQRRQWQPSPVLLPRKSHGRRSLIGCSSWGLEELDRTE